MESTTGLEETTNFFRVIGLVVDVGTELLRKVLHNAISPVTLASVLRNPMNDKIIERLHKQKRPVITKPQYELLRKNDIDAKDFDISLLAVLLRNICKTIEPPAHPKGWDVHANDLKEDDTSFGASILRLKEQRNSVTAHATSTRMPTVKFNEIWNNTSAIIHHIAEKIHKTEDEVKLIDQEMESIKKIKIDPSGDKEQRWLETFRQGQLQELEEIKQDVVEILADVNKESSSQLREAIYPKMEYLYIRIKRLILPNPEDKWSQDSQADLQVLRETLKRWEKRLEQRQEMVKYYGYDAYIFYAKADEEACRDTTMQLKGLSDISELKIALYEDLPLDNFTMEECMEYILDNCRYLLFYVTPSFKEDTMKMFETDMCLRQIIREKSYRAIPLWTKRKEVMTNIPRVLDVRTGLTLCMLSEDKFQQNTFINKFTGMIKEGRQNM